jgi:protein-L-isoaspartate(D-aspartate) O-methyltransferase
MQNIQHALDNMVAGQMLPNEVTDHAVLAAIAAVKRDLFTPELMKTAAYADENIPLGHHRVMMKPFIFARLLQLANIQKTDKVLHIGAGTGYGSAVLSQLAGHVMAVESQHDLAEIARKNLQEAKVNVEIFQSSLTLGYPLSAPYDVIFIEGAVQSIPSGLSEQLTEGGRIVAVKNIQQRMDAHSGLGRAMVVQKINGQLQEITSFDASVALLPGFEKKEEFVL